MILKGCAASPCGVVDLRMAGRLGARKEGGGFRGDEPMALKAPSSRVSEDRLEPHVCIGKDAAWLVMEDSCEAGRVGDALGKGLKRHVTLTILD
ncbi:hypothetical protein E2C01_003292 [Portunus trituberculatus]|uniref:Uncharacterized protein n=1 Tax=Portunus trituberculatus TaxID=210409 RepID=A0A5B7CLU0_PORTR|nr:hypothetical protein [Portunus trituberculatus]